MENEKRKCKLFCGEVTLKKKELWLVGIACLMSGIVIGILNAPWTHGVKITCGNSFDRSYDKAKEELID